MCHLIPTIFLASLFLLSAYSTPAQSSTSSSCPCALRGSVVDSVSGQPVPHALVKLSGASSGAALTDSDGKFQFEGLPAGSMILEAEKPGFLAQDPFARWYPASAQLQLAPDSPAALLKLIPEGAIFGQVSDENSEPLEGFAVSVFLRAAQDRHNYRDPNPNQRHAVTTDDEGKFRIAGLRPGSYYLALRQPQGAVLSPSRKPAAPTGYAPVFYPGVSEMSAAAPLKVHPGTSIQANFSLKRVPFIRLSGTVSGYEPQQHVALVLWDLRETQPNSDIPFDHTTGSFQTKWIPPGTYTLTAESVDFAAGGSTIPFFATQTVNATSNLSGLHLALQPSLQVPVVIHGLAPTGNETLQAVPPVVALIPKAPIPSSPLTINLNAQPQGDLSASFSNITPGTYELEIEPRYNPAYYIESANWGSVNLLREDLVLDSSGSVPPIDLVLRDDGATLRGKVLSGETSPRMLVVLLSYNRRPGSVGVRGDGAFEISGVAPGTYRVFAVDSSANFDPGDPVSLAKISSKAQEVTLAPKQSASINLELATVEE